MSFRPFSPCVPCLFRPAALAVGVGALLGAFLCLPAGAQQVGQQPGQPAAAQETPTTDAQKRVQAGGQEGRKEGGPDAGSLPAVTVTARGVRELAQDAPLTVDVIDGQDVDERRMLSLEDSLHSVPGVEMHSGGAGNTYLWIRGTGSLSHTSLDDTSVGIRIDGATQGLEGLERNLYDVRQVEVLKGPQGTLYGSQSDAGAVHVSTHDPEPGFDAYVQAGLGTDRLRRVQGMVNAPLGQGLSLRVAGMAQRQDDYIHDRHTGRPLNTRENQGLRAKLLWQPNARTDAMVTAWHDRRLGDAPLMLVPPFGDTPSLNSAGIAQNATHRSRGAQLDVRHRFDGFELHSRSSWTRYAGLTHGFYVQPDLLPYLFASLGVPAPVQPMLGAFYANPANNRQRMAHGVRTLEQDVRLSALPGSRVQWVAGLHLQQRERDFGYDALRTIMALPAPLPPLNADAHNAHTQRNYRIRTQALYGELTWPLTAQLKAIGGLRWAHESNDYRAHWQPHPANPLGAIGAQTQRMRIGGATLTGRAGLDWAFAPQWHAWGLYSRGHKPGGFNDYGTNIAYGQADNPYQSGRIHAVELGVKGGAADGRWGLSAALFRNAVRSDKITVTLYPSFISQPFNVDTRSQGLELSGFARLSPQWRLNASASFIDAKVTAVPAAQQNHTRVGNRVPQVPRASAALGLEYRQRVQWPAWGQGLLFARADLRHVGRRAAEANNALMLPSHTLVDAAVGLRSRHAELSLWVRNLGNRHWMRFAYMPQGQGLYTGLPAPGRTVGVDFRYNF